MTSVANLFTQARLQTRLMLTPDIRRVVAGDYQR